MVLLTLLNLVLLPPILRNQQLNRLNQLGKLLELDMLLLVLLLLLMVLDLELLSLGIELLVLVLVQGKQLGKL